MPYDAELAERLNVALNEADVAGVIADSGTRAARLLLHVHALPEDRPPDPDTRRALVLSDVSAIRVLLRRERPPDGGTIQYGPALPLADLDALNAFIGGAFQRNSQYGWRFLDAEDELTDDWPADVSLDLAWPGGSAAHTIFWFAECLVTGADGTAAHCAEGLLRFADLAVERADGTRIPLTTFAEDGVRWWTRLHADDPRVSADAQRATQPPPPWPNEPATWPWSTTIVPGS